MVDRPFVRRRPGQRKTRSTSGHVTVGAYLNELIHTFSYLFERDHAEKEAEEVARRAAKVVKRDRKRAEDERDRDIIIDCKNYKEVHGMFPGQGDCEPGRKLQNLKQTAAGTKCVSVRPQPQLETLLK